MYGRKRGPFEKSFKKAVRGSRRKVEKYTSQGIAVSVKEREEKQKKQDENTMMSTTKFTIVEAFTDNTITSKEFFFISGNYFTKIDNEYLPAEVAMVKFSFEHGILQRLHTYVAPENLQMGTRFIAKEHSQNTHQLPIPPQSKGETDYQYILNKMKNFMGEPLPILFTLKENIPMIKSFIKSFTSSEDIDCYRVYPLHPLLFEMKKTAVENSVKERSSFESIHIAEEHLRRGDYTYSDGMACQYHEELDCARYCALAHVQNWAYIFFHHICDDLNIERISGIHSPSGQSDFLGQSSHHVP